MTSRNYLITYFLQDEQAKAVHDRLVSMEPKYCGGQCEVCPHTGRLHYQAFVQFESPIRGAQIKAVVGQRTHYKPVSILRAAAIGYGIKEETRFEGPWEYGTKPVPRVAKERLDWSKNLSLVLQKDYSALDPEVVFRFVGNFPKIASLFERDQRSSAPTWLPNPWGLILWARKASKRRHYWIWSSSPNRGKTSCFAKPLAKDYRFAIKAGDYSYWNLSGEEEGIILDDFNTAALKWSYLNVMCDGTCEYRRIYKSSVVLNDPLIIILSNKSIIELYPNTSEYLYARFNEISVEKH